MHTQQWADEAGGHEDGGRVREPRKRERGGPQAMPHATARDSRRRAVAGRPESWRRQGACPGDHRGLRAGQAGSGGTRDRGRAQGVRGEPQGEEGRPVRQRRPARGGGSGLSGAPGMRQGPQARRALQGIGEGQGGPHDAESGSWPSSRTRGPLAGNRRLLGGKVGHRWPRDPLAGRRRRAERFAGRPSGSDAGSTHRLPDTPAQCRTGHTLSREGVEHRVSRDRLGGRAGRLASDLSAPGAGGGQGTSRAVCRHPGRAPPGPARAAPRQSGGGAARRAGLERAGRGDEAAARHPLRRRHNGPASGGEEAGGSRRARCVWVVPGLAPRAQSTPSAPRAARAGSDVDHRLERRRGGQGMVRPSRLGPSAGV